MPAIALNGIEFNLARAIASPQNLLVKRREVRRNPSKPKKWRKTVARSSPTGSAAARRFVLSRYRSGARKCSTTQVVTRHFTSYLWITP
jgi:hypothetical protein